MIKGNQLAVADMSQLKQGPVLSKEQGFLGYSRKGSSTSRRTLPSSSTSGSTSSRSGTGSEP